MIEMKLLEIRDTGTLVPALALRMRSTGEWLLERGGVGDQGCVYLMRLTDAECHYDAYEWTYARTMKAAHLWIVKHYDELADGQVVDVRVILGEATEPAKSEATS